jgi:hypothetical protein
MWTPFEEKEQPPDDTWANHTLGKIALRVHQIAARSSAMHNTQAVMDETVTALSTEVRKELAEVRREIAMFRAGLASGRVPTGTLAATQPSAEALARAAVATRRSEAVSEGVKELTLDERLAAARAIGDEVDSGKLPRGDEPQYRDDDSSTADPGSSDPGSSDPSSDPPKYPAATKQAQRTPTGMPSTSADSSPVSIGPTGATVHLGSQLSLQLERTQRARAEKMRLQQQGSTDDALQT